jgi:signal peptidase I
MIVDGDYLFVFPSSYQRDKYMLCIDINSGNYLSKSLLLPGDPGVSTIKDGYVYETGTRKPEGYAVIEKYSIDKAVYGK